MKRSALPLAMLCALASIHASAGAPPGTDPAPATQSLTSTPEAQAFVEQLAERMSAGDPATFRKAFDIPALSGRSFGGLDAPADLRRGFEIGVSAGLDQMTTAISDNMKKGGKYTFLHLHMVDGELRAMFRMTGPTGLNYHDLVLQVHEPDTVRIIDLHMATTGELISASYHRLLLPLVAGATKGANANLTQDERDYVDNIGQVKDVSQKLLAKDYAGVHAIYESLPESLQKEQVLMLYNLQSLARIDKKQFVDAMDRYEKAFPDSPSLSLLRIDSTAMAQDWTGLLSTLDKLDKQVGGDPFLNVFRVKALQGLGRSDEALAAGEACLKADPHCAEAYVALLHALAAQKNWPGTADMMERMLAYTGKFLPTMTSDADFSEFIQTPEFSDFKSAHPALKFHAAD